MMFSSFSLSLLPFTFLLLFIILVRDVFAVPHKSSYCWRFRLAESAFRNFPAGMRERSENSLGQLCQVWYPGEAFEQERSYTNEGHLRSHGVVLMLRDVVEVRP